MPATTGTSNTAGVAWHTGSGGAAAFSVKNPRVPEVVQATDEQGSATPYNEALHSWSGRLVMRVVHAAWVTVMWSMKRCS